MTVFDRYGWTLGVLCLVGSACRLPDLVVPASGAPSQPTAPPASQAPAVEPSPEQRRDWLRESHFPVDAPRECETIDTDEGYVQCLLTQRFSDDPEAAALAQRINSEHGVVCGASRPEEMKDDGIRGDVHVQPSLPLGPDREHLAWVLESFNSLDWVVSEMRKRAPADTTFFFPKPRVVRFFRTLETDTPSAFARDDEVSYNLRGRLCTSSESVFETLVHELFHLADAKRGDWSKRVLFTTYEAIVSGCRDADDPTCFDRFAPHETKVNGGEYYAFHPLSDVCEYGGELAARFVREQRRQAQASDAPAGPRFKCLAPENQIVWRQFSEEFFGGVDLVPECETEVSKN